MLCPICATEMNNSPKCPFCGHVCSPDEDNTVKLNGEVISTGHRNRWCRTTDDPHLAEKVVDGMHYHPQDAYAGNPYAADQAAVGSEMSGPDMAGQFSQGISFEGDIIPYCPNQETSYGYSTWYGMQMETPGEGQQRQKVNKTVKWFLIIFILITWGLPILFAIISFIIVMVANFVAG